MFGKLKDKLKDWAKSVSDSESVAEDVPSKDGEEVLAEDSNKEFDSDVEDLDTAFKVEEILKEKEASFASTSANGKASSDKSESRGKADKLKAASFASTPTNAEAPLENPTHTGVPTSDDEGKGGGKEIEFPMKFNVGSQKYDPDLEELENKEKQLKEEIKKERDNFNKLEELAPSGVPIKGKEGKVVVDAPVSDEEKGIFQKIKSSALGKITITDTEFDLYKDDLEMILLENNVAMDVVLKILEELKDRVVGVEIPKKELETNLKINLREIIEGLLVEPFDLVERIKSSGSDPYIILFCGINGVGKTTTIAKFVKILKDEGVSSVLAAGDTFRAASIEQLKIHGNKLNVPVIAHDYGSDPAAVGFDAIKYAKKNKIDCVLIDTAGRMHTAKNLLAELGKVARVCKPDSKIFLGESISGNDSVSQVRAFDEAVSIDGIILSKADIDDKGGTALSVGFVTGKPILYLGVGQNYGDLEKFDKLKFVESLGL